MNRKPFIPKHKDDYESLSILKESSFEEISPYIADLLIWIQDMNWPVSRDIANILSSYTNLIEKQIIDILKGNDDIWKYWSIQELLLYSKEETLNDNLTNELMKIIKYPTVGEIEEDVVEMAKNVLIKFHIKLPNSKA